MMAKGLVVADEPDVLGEAWTVRIIDVAHLERAGAQKLVRLLHSRRTRKGLLLEGKAFFVDAGNQELLDNREAINFMKKHNSPKS